MDLLLGLLFFALGFIGVAVIASRNRPIARALVAGFLARGAFALADVLVLGLSMAGDGAGWDNWAWLWARKGLGEILSHVETGHNLYKVFMALMYYFFGHSPLMIQMVNAFLGTLVILVAWKLSRLLGAEDKATRRVAWLVALFPSIVLHAGFLAREVAVTLPLTYGVYQIAAWHRHRRVKNAVLAGAALLVSMAFHSGAFAVILALAAWAAGSWIKAFFTGRIKLVARNTAALLLAGGAVAFASTTGWGMEKFSQIDTDDVGTLAQTQDYASRGRTAYLGELHAESTPELAVQSPLRLAYFLFAPFPWMLSGLRDAIGFADALLFLWLVWLLLRGRRILRQNPTALLVVALFGAMAFTFALGVSNYGTAFRHRNKMLPMLITVAALVPGTGSRKGPALFPGGKHKPLALSNAPRDEARKEGTSR